jgi:hypothetical protein
MPVVEITPLDALERFRDSIGEDPLTGVAPVEIVGATFEDADLDDQDPEEVSLNPLTKDQANQRLGRTPCEALFWILTARFGKKWWELEWEVLLEDLAKAGFFLDGPGHAKVMALWSIMRAPDFEMPFYRHYAAFLFLTASLMGRPVKWGELVVPTPVECATAMNIVLDIRPMGFSDEVLGAVASCCLYHGMWCFTGILTSCQEAVLSHLTYHKIPVGVGDVDKVRNRVIGMVKEGKTSDDALDPDEEGLDEREEILRVQTLRVMDFMERFDELTQRAENARDAVFKHHQNVLMPSVKERSST